MLARWGHWVWIYCRLQALHLRVQLEYEADFWVGIVAVLLRHATGVVFLWTVFRHVPELQGWSQGEMLFLYALAILPMGMVELFYNGPSELAAIINLGQLDGMLMRPLPAALQVVTAFSNLQGLGSVLLGVALLVHSAVELQLDLQPWHCLFLIVSVLCSTLLVGSLGFIANLMSFWEPDSNLQLPDLVMELAEMARYPLSLYGRVLRVLTTWVLPFAFVSYYPGSVLLKRPEANPWLGWGAPLVGLGLTLLATRLWRHGLARYQGIGG